MRTHFFMETVTSVSRAWRWQWGKGVWNEQERFFQMNEQMNEYLKWKKKTPNPKLFKVTN